MPTCCTKSAHRRRTLNDTSSQAGGCSAFCQPGGVNPRFQAVLWDFGGVILTSPFEAFARYEAENGLPPNLIRTINATNPDANAWARFERSEVDLDGFCALFEAEASDLGHSVDGRAIMALLNGQLRPQMVAALHQLKADGYLLALLTNNVAVGRNRVGTVVEDDAGKQPDDRAAVIAIFDHVIESSVVGYRKPEPKFYSAACEALNVEPHQCVFLDDLGINLKPAAAMGMHTIKVTDPDDALAQLWSALEVGS
jgi:putative hydrolase of the HAD superfamily